MGVLTDKIVHAEMVMTATTSAFSSLLLIACKPARTEARWNAFQCYIQRTHGATAALSWLAHAACGANQVLQLSATKSNNLCKPYGDHLQQQQHAWSSMERSAGSSNLMGWPSGWPSGAVGGRLPAVDIMRLCSFTCSTVWKREMMVQCCFMSVPSTMSIISLRKRTCTRQGHHHYHHSFHRHLWADWAVFKLTYMTHTTWVHWCLNSTLWVSPADVCLIPQIW